MPGLPTRRVARRSVDEAAAASPGGTTTLVPNMEEGEEDPLVAGARAVTDQKWMLPVLSIEATLLALHGSGRSFTMGSRQLLRFISAAPLPVLRSVRLERKLTPSGAPSCAYTTPPLRGWYASARTVPVLTIGRCFRAPVMAQHTKTDLLQVHTISDCEGTLTTFETSLLPRRVPNETRRTPRAGRVSP